MDDEILTRERILEVAEELLRRFGPAKTTVVDVARALRVSHGSIYRHFPSKAALREAVTERWLAQVSDPLEQLVGENGPALARLRRWLEMLIASKRARAFDDPEMFATYLAVAAEANDVVKAHVRHLAEQLARIIADGNSQGIFAVADPISAGWGVYNATIRFHNPVHAQEWSDPGIDTAFEGVWSLVLQGLMARQTSP